MKREIKFRAFNNSMVKSDSYVSLTYFFDGCENSEHIMQFTGLQDRNGVDIYEGDIIQCDRIYWEEKRNLVVEYDSDSAAFYLLNKKDSVDSETFENTSIFCVSKYEREIIGNIHENPELI